MACFAIRVVPSLPRPSSPGLPAPSPPPHVPSPCPLPSPPPSPQMYQEMGSRHRVQFPCIQIIKTATIPASACVRPNIMQVRRAGCGGGRGGGLILCSHLSTPRLFWGLGVGGGHFGAALCFGSTSRQPWVLDPHQGSLCLLGCYTWHAQVRILVRIRHHHHHQVFFSRFRFSWAQGAG